MPAGLELLPVGVVELVAVAVPLGDRLGCRSSWPPCCPGASRAGWAPSRIVPPLSVIALLLVQQADHRVGVVLVELGGVGPLQAQHVAGELDHGALHAQADAEEGDAALRGRSGWPRPCPRCRARRSRRAPARRRRRPAAARALRARPPRCGSAGCGPGPGGPRRRGPGPRRSTCRRRGARRTCPPRRW